jgi:hypothetical protein
MADTITPQEARALQAAFAEGDTMSAAQSQALALPADIRELFCRNWETAKQILNFLASLPVLPAVVRAAIAMVIKAGDIAHRTLCA